MNRRTLLVTAGWLGAAILAVVVGITAINVIGAGLTSHEPRPYSAAEVDRLLRAAPSADQGLGAAPTAAPSPAGEVSSAPPSVGPPSVGPSSGGPSSGGPSSAGPASRTLSTRAGTVVARCDDEGGPEIISMSPRPGFALHDQDDDEGEFRSTTDDGDRLTFEITCTGATPALTTLRNEDED